jgi:ATP-dependent Lhr-like helicase
LSVVSLAGEPVHTIDTEQGISENGSEESATFLGQWLQFYGPVTVDFIRGTLGIEDEHLRLILEDLIDSEKVIEGQLVIGEAEEVCDSENFETLLRLLRVESVPAFEPLGVEWLPLFLADYQGITRPKENIEGLYESMEQLLCYPAEAGAWESEIFPARLRPYDPSWLDTLMQEGELLWMGSEGHRVAFCFESDLDLLREESAEEIESLPLPPSLFPEGAGRYDFSALARFSGSGEAELAKRLWDQVWQSRVTNDTFLALRRALMSKFKLPDTSSMHSAGRLRHRASRRVSLAEKKEVHFFAGNWRQVLKPEFPDDLLEREELRKDRVRLLLDRYGILFRELLQREHPALRWSSVFRALRIMELSGEVMAGLFFHGIPGPQFISQRAFRSLQRKPPDAVYWINAADPASLCGIQLESIHGMLPARVASTHLVYRGTKLVVVSKRNGRDLTFHVSPDDPSLPHYLVSLQHLLTRKFQPMKRIVIETINGEEAPQSPYVPVFRTSFDVSVDPHEVALYRKIR